MAFQKQIAKLQEIVAQLSTADTTVVHVSILTPLYQPNLSNGAVLFLKLFNAIGWTSASPTTWWLHDDAERLSPHHDNHIVIELTAQSTAEVRISFLCEIIQVTSSGMQFDDGGWVITQPANPMAVLHSV
jgi:hypothetical protein